VSIEEGLKLHSEGFDVTHNPVTRTVIAESENQTMGSYLVNDSKEISIFDFL
jgi:hypothetical protein